ncbi:hypothetical protein ACTQ49_04950 [Luteococcus sp. Sow4_B9]|uniref:hypothetical protein n=1 Tax=Luteococcus sp. Sow4_B9 TaxID=3438792 RepID=UPI003F978613
MLALFIAIILLMSAAALAWFSDSAQQTSAAIETVLQARDDDPVIADEQHKAA